MADSSGKGILLKSDQIANVHRDEIQTILKTRSSSPKLVGILSTSAAPSRFYAEFTQKQCNALGIIFELRKTGAALGLEEGAGEGDGVEEAIIEANDDPTVDGIMVYYPVFGVQQDHYLQQIVSPLKDVEGLNFKFHYNLYHNIRFIRPSSLTSALPPADAPHNAKDDNPPPGTVKSILPCTPLAVVKCLESTGVYNKILPYGDRAYGKTVTVINRSEVVGRPLAALLANDGARVFSVDIDSIQEYTKRPKSSGPEPSRYHPRHVVHPCPMKLEQCLALSDVVVSAVPNPDYKVQTEWLKDGCICVNVAADKNFEKDVRDKASIYLPTIGKVTIMMLLRNLLRLQQYQESMQTLQTTS
ncbi:NAD(P)-binding protein [Punctularia strigosozonata HHB-11173 SS5]|uniref:NAD(P)-binding protein n=1 Tax=Punctularia strigosozonata (strain HHB-11173) TaxID=741275 RepID=UPI0004417278|nr:NAD(P)-binding protein [Punctularia strigosozonata HHB-11173 SS5]EIN10847.1 NAD(P)-binding protein [Punctularia strigosozonata HHB-11173 SS5]